MRKRLMIGLAAGALLAAMAPGVASATDQPIWVKDCLVPLVTEPQWLEDREPTWLQGTQPQWIFIDKAKWDPQPQWVQDTQALSARFCD